MDRGMRTFYVILAFLSGVLVANVGWIIPSTVYWGGGGNVATIVLFVLLSVVFLIISLFGPEQ